MRKGPYFADEGDFASVGSIHIGLIDRTEKGLAQITAGSFGYRRLFGMDSAKVGDGSLLVAGEIGTYNGPWDNPDNVRKLNGLVRYSQGTATRRRSPSPAWPMPTNGIRPTRCRSARSPADFSTASARKIRATAATPTASRCRAASAQSDDAGSWKANAYVVKSQLDLFNNFTYFLSDPVLGDQFHQHDDRIMAGANASRTLNGSFAGLPMQTTFGVQIAL